MLIRKRGRVTRALHAHCRTARGKHGRRARYTCATRVQCSQERGGPARAPNRTERASGAHAHTSFSAAHAPQMHNGARHALLCELHRARPLRERPCPNAARERILCIVDPLLNPSKLSYIRHMPQQSPARPRRETTLYQRPTSTTTLHTLTHQCWLLQTISCVF